MIQTIKVAIESSTMTGTKYAAMESASFWIGACTEKEKKSFHRRNVMTVNVSRLLENINFH